MYIVGRKVKLSHCLIKHHAMMMWRIRCIALCIIHIGTRQKLVTRFMPQLLYPEGKRLWCPLYRRLDQSQNSLEVVKKGRIF
jgi:hypothetical protein